MQSLIKYVNQTDGGERGPLHWGRAKVDGFPFRGQNPPLMREEEAAERLVRVSDFRNGDFDISDPAQNKSFCNVMDGITIGWFELVFIDRFRDPEKTRIYVEWVEYYMEDGTATPAFR
jgi:hypothetical protein